MIDWGMMLRSLLLVAAILPLRAAAAQAGVRQVQLTSPGTIVAFRAYGLGLFPLDGNFSRFDGVLTYDDAQAGVCRVDLRVEVASLMMSDQSIRNDLVGPEFMNAGEFPTLRFQGTCQGPELVGQLAMRGVTRPFALDLSPEGTVVTAQGRLRRAEWGMTARPFVGGSTARITVQVTVPTLWSAR